MSSLTVLCDRDINEGMANKIMLASSYMYEIYILIEFSKRLGYQKNRTLIQFIKIQIVFTFTFLKLFGLLECLVRWLISMPVIKV